MFALVVCKLMATAINTLAHLFFQSVQQSLYYFVSLSRACPIATMAFDPGSYGGFEVGVAVGWCCRLRKAAYAPISRIHADKHPRPDLVEVPAVHDHLMLTRKFQRFASYKNLQAISQAVRQWTTHPLEWFRLPDDFTCRMVRAGEVRVVKDTGDRCIAFIVNLATRATIRELPENVEVSLDD